MDVVHIDEASLHPMTPHRPNEEPRCLFFKDHVCNPYKTKFPICLKCHRCKVITVQNALPQLFDRIVMMALAIINTMGLGSGQASVGTGSAGSGSAGSGEAGGASGGAGGGGGGS